MDVERVDNGINAEEGEYEKNGKKEVKGGGEKSVEEIFESQEVPLWKNQLTIRAFGVSFLLSIMFSFIVMKLNLTTGIIPSLNVSAGLLGFFFVKTWTKMLQKSGLLKQPFTRQENTVIQTCVVASSGIAFSGGFGSYLFGMSERIAKQSDDNGSFKNPSLGWIIGFLFVVSFLGLFSVLPLRKIMVIDFKLTYPSGTATAHLINSFHTPQGGKMCGFVNFPTFGIKAYKNKFYFDFSTTYVGVGMICPYIINISVLLGGVLSWGLMWPLIETRKGDWYPAGIPASNMHGLQGYKVFIAIAMILGDGLYNFFKVFSRTLTGLFQQVRGKQSLPVANRPSTSDTSKKISYDDQRRTEIFLKDQIPVWFSVAGYVTIAIISTIALPHVFHDLKWYYILVIYVFAPTLAFCNAYGCGLTDWSLASTYGKLAILRSELGQDFKTGYLTLASPRAMFVSQVIGTAMGCIVSPCVFWLFYKAFDDFGVPDSQYPAPFAIVYRNMAILGFRASLLYQKTVSYFVMGSLDMMGKKWGSFIPLPMAMAIPFYIGPYFAIDMCIGSLILFVWEKLNKAKADAFAPAVASGLICGDGIWTLPSSILALAGIKPPICMKFLSRASNAKVDTFLGS
ncbi:hypothetical protein CXB51_003951 [Gossypium anomalum]|uniref:Uncharacterized protein n=1 Tax=Gossypium anomalum TaxID=47600 RepID=A0A8J6DAL5_9ROSI|nr:hypothetical protein CXB51_003951 [Gossypium anomalum]